MPARHFLSDYGDDELEFRVENGLASAHCLTMRRCCLPMIALLAQLAYDAAASLALISPCTALRLMRRLTWRRLREDDGRFQDRLSDYRASARQMTIAAISAITGSFQHASVEDGSFASERQ